MVDTLVHPSNKPVDLVFPVASIPTFYKMGGLFLHSSSWRRLFYFILFYFGEHNLKGHRKLLASLKHFPTYRCHESYPPCR